jgi:polar amino acid transport system permease protein
MLFLPSKARFTRLDGIIAVVVAGVAAWVAWRVNAGLDYDWDWSIVGNYLAYHDEETGWTPNLLLRGLFTTIRLSLWAMVFACVVGTIVGLMRTSRMLLARLLARTYVEFIRNTPPLVLIFIFYFFIGDQILSLLGVDELVYQIPDGAGEWLSYVAARPGALPEFLSALLTLALYEAAFIAEIVRSGISSVEKGQWEASYALGLSRYQRMRHVILPQALRRMVPPLTGQFISTIKDSAIVSIISIPELTFQGMEIMASTYRTFEVWLTVLAMYFVLCLTLSLLSRRLERRFKV